MSQPETYVGLDVSLESTALCVVDGTGAIVWRGTCPTDAAELAALIRKRAPGAVRIGLETGQLSNWLTLSLRNRGLPVLCLDARHAKAALKMQINKTDANDAWGLAQVVRTGWFREVAVKSMDASQLRTLLVARAKNADEIFLCLGAENYAPRFCSHDGSGAAARAFAPTVLR